MTASVPSDTLRRARRALEAIPGYRLLDDLAWHQETSRWFLRCRLTSGVLGEQFPDETDWCVVVEDREIGGKVSIYPATDGGIDQTFPHQLFNDLPSGPRPWRTGKICTTTPWSIRERLGQRSEPLGLVDRLVWHVQRALLWIECASTGNLAIDGDPFELPDFPTRNPSRFVFSEDQSSLQPFRDARQKRGLALLRRIALPAGDTFFVDQFQTDQGAVIRTVNWGSAITNSSPDDIARWVLFDSVPLIGPWQVPATFDELSRATNDLSRSVEDLLLPFPDRLRDGRPHLLLIGFPIPDDLGGEPVQLHWQALSLPVLERRVLRGFRNNHVGWKKVDRRTLSSNNSIDWLGSENWSPEISHARGRLAAEVSSRKILILGAGSLGSAVAELLVRGGSADLTICDGDVLQQGNLARHSLRIQDVGRNKAHALADRLQWTSAHVRVGAVPSYFPDLTPEQIDQVSGCDLVVDCTAEESALSAIETHPWTSDTYVLSMSFGWHVQRLYVVGAGSENFTKDAVVDLLNPYEEQDLSENSSADMVREAPGCWHPVFPGRCDDVWVMAGMGTQELERLATEIDRRLKGTLYKWLRNETSEGVTRQVIA